jgi:uncharacterized membrane protein YtjA (UPF0391 family)
MIRWAIGFLGVSIVSALVGFTRVASFVGAASEAALAGKWIFCAGLVLTGVTLLHGPRTVT